MKIQLGTHLNKRSLTIITYIDFLPTTEQLSTDVKLSQNA